MNASPSRIAAAMQTRQNTWFCLLIGIVFFSPNAIGQITAVKTCNSLGIGSVKLIADAPVTITSVSTGSVGEGPSAMPYCLVKVRVPQAINVWVALPMNGHWNGRMQSEGGGGYAGLIGVPLYSILGGYVGIQTDTGHTYKAQGSGQAGGGFGLLSPGVPNTALQKDFAYRSQHLMAVIGKQLAQAFYGRQPLYSYWNGCSEGGREGLRMAQDFPGDYDGILAGAPAIQWDRAAAYELWPQVVMKDVAGGVISIPKLKLATNAAIAACDAMDQVTDGIITDPRRCRYSAATDTRITKTSCDSTTNTCLTPKEAAAIDSIWEGPTNAKGELLWPGVERGASLDMLAGREPSVFALDQARYWVYLDPTWDWHVLTLANYEEFFNRSVRLVHPVLGTDQQDLSAFRRRGGKLISWHGFSDPLIMPQSSIMYYDSVAKGRSYNDTQQFFRLFMAPGVEHCTGGAAPQPGRPPGSEWTLAVQESMFKALVNWVERGQAPDSILASQSLDGGATRTRPLCPYPALAKYTGRGSTDDAANFICATQ